MLTIKPKTRKEIYLAYLSGDMSLELPEPLTRDEVNLYNLCKNKAYGEYTTVKEVLAECQFEMLDEATFATKERFEIAVGEKYIVNWNGVDYACTAYAGNIEGSISLLNDGTNMDTGEGCVVNIGYIAEGMSGYYGVAYPTDGSTTLTISIRQEVTTVQKISGKFVEGMGWSEVTKSHSDTLTWDGVGSADDPSGEVYGILITYHRVSDDVPSVEQLSAGGIYTLCQNSEFMDTEFTSSDVQDNTSVGFIVVGPVIIACTDNVTAQGLTFPKAGIYFMSMPEEYASGFKVNGYQFETVSETIHPIDQKFLPVTTFYAPYSSDGGVRLCDESGNEITYEQAKAAMDTMVRIYVENQGGYVYPICVADRADETHVEFCCVSFSAGLSSAIFIGGEPTGGGGGPV